MVVTEDVKNLDQMLLIGAGTALSERHIGILQAWGVPEVEVGAAEASAGPGDCLEKLPPEVAARLTAELKALFWELDESCPVQAEVFKLALNRRAAKQLGGANP